MKNYIIFMGIALTIVVIICGCSRVNADINEEIVFVKYPIFFGEDGVDPTPLKKGSCLKLPWTKAYHIKLIPEQYEEGFSNLVTKDQASISLNAFLTLSIKEGNSPVLLKNFGEEWYKNSVQEKFREIVRNKLCSYNMSDLVVIRNQYEEDIKKFIETNMLSYFEEKKLPLKIESIVFSKAEPSDGIKKEMEQMSIYETKIKTEKMRKLAEEARKESLIAQTEAEKVVMEIMEFTSAQYIDYLRALALTGRNDILRIENIK